MKQPSNARNRTAPKVLIFDLFGVIAQTQDPVEARALLETAQVPDEKFWHAYWAFRLTYDQGKTTANEYWTSIGSHLGIRFEPSVIEDLTRYDVRSWAGVNDKMVALLEELASTQRLALLSNIPLEITRHYVRLHKWLDLFEVRAFSTYTGHAKPSPAAYEWCLAELGVAPEDVLFIDDREENLHAAENLGIPVHLFSSPENLICALDKGLAYDA